jgi:hypothetical protein
MRSIYFLDKESQIMELNIESELLKRDSEIASLKAKSAQTEIDLEFYRKKCDILETHLRDAKANIVLLMSKIQEFEAREY